MGKSLMVGSFFQVVLFTGRLTIYAEKNSHQKQNMGGLKSVSSIISVQMHFWVCIIWFCDERKLNMLITTFEAE